MKDFLTLILNYIPKIGIFDLIEITIMIFVLYEILVLIKNTKAWIFLKGIIMLTTFYIISDILSFNAIKMIFQGLFSAILILLIVVFQQELKKLLGEIGKRGNIIQFKFKKEKEYDKIISDENIKNIVSAVESMSKVKTGALILIEKDLPLKEYSETGIKIDSNISEQMLIQIFEKNTPLHDGAIIINNDKIESATCYLPLSNSDKINKSLGTRHRAGIGISEVTDCFVIIISEETGKISSVSNGKINYDISPKFLEKQLNELQQTNIQIKKKNVFKHNIKYKIASIVGAFFLWIVLINSSDPTITKTITNVNVSVKNENIITDSGMSYQILDGDTVDISVSGKKSLIDDITEKNITAYTDLANLSITDATEIITECNIYGITSSPKTKMMRISVEDTKEVDYDIEIKQEGNLNTDNYISSIELDNNNIKISGPISKIDVIGSVVAPLNISNVSDMGVVLTKPIIYDKNGEEMDVDDLNVSIDSIKATIHMYETKQVPLTIAIDSQNDNGEIVSYSYNKDFITIAADESSLDTTTGVFMEIPIKIDESVKTSSFVKVINLNDFIPEGIYLAESNNKLNIDISYEEYTEKEITINTDDIIFENTSSKYDYSLKEPLIIKAKGLSKDIENISINPSIDVNNIKEGTSNLDVIIDNEFVKDSYKAVVEVN